MRLPRNSGAFAVLLLSVLPINAATPIRIVEIPENPERFTIGSVPPIWDKGFLVGFNRSAIPGVPPRIWMNDRAGRAIIDGAEVSLPDAYHVVVHSVAAADGGVLISAEVWDSPGRHATVLCHMKPPGVIDHVVRNESFTAERLLVRPDGGIWGLGRNPFEWLKRDADYALLERYSANGELLGRYLKRSVVTPGDDMVGSGVLGPGAIGASKERVGVFLPDLQTWFEFDSGGKLVDRFRVPPPMTVNTPGSPAKPLRAWGIGMTESNRVYMIFSPPVGVLPSREHGAGLYQLDRQAHRWVRVPPEGDRASGYGLIYGVDGELIIARSGCCRYGWFEVPDVVNPPQTASR